MKPQRNNGRTCKTRSETELLLLPGGELLVHNLTPAMARLLEGLDPAMRARTGGTELKNNRTRESL